MKQIIALCLSVLVLTACTSHPYLADKGSPNNPAPLCKHLKRQMRKVEKTQSHAENKRLVRVYRSYHCER